MEGIIVITYCTQGDIRDMLVNTYWWARSYKVEDIQISHQPPLVLPQHHLLPHQHLKLNATQPQAFASIRL